MLVRDFLLLTTLFCFGGCSGTDEVGSRQSAVGSHASLPTAYRVLPTNAGARFITATPNPVHVEHGKDGTTKIEWQTGDNDYAEVYVIAPGEPEKLFNGGKHNGSSDAKWIKKGGRYEFILYDGKEHKTKLASVIVTTD